MSWGYLGALARPRNHGFPTGTLTFRAKMTVWETHTFRAIKTVLEICQQLPRTKTEMFELLENSPRRRGLLSNIQKTARSGLQNSNGSSENQIKTPTIQAAVKFRGGPARTGSTPNQPSAGRGVLLLEALKCRHGSWIIEGVLGPFAP